MRLFSLPFNHPFVATGYLYYSKTTSRWFLAFIFCFSKQTPWEQPVLLSSLGYFFSGAFIADGMFEKPRFHRFAPIWVQIKFVVQNLGCAGYTSVYYRKRCFVLSPGDICRLDQIFSDRLRYSEWAFSKWHNNCILNFEFIIPNIPSSHQKSWKIAIKGEHPILSLQTNRVYKENN